MWFKIAAALLQIALSLLLLVQEPSLSAGLRDTIVQTECSAAEHTAELLQQAHPLVPAALLAAASSPVAGSSTASTSAASPHSRLQFAYSTGTVSLQLNPLPPYTQYSKPELFIETAGRGSTIFKPQVVVYVQRPDGHRFRLYSGTTSTAGRPTLERRSLPSLDQESTWSIIVMVTVHGVRKTRTLTFVTYNNPYGRSLAFASAAWFDFGSLMSGVYHRRTLSLYNGLPQNAIKDETRSIVRNMYRIGIKTIIISYVEYGRIIYYPAVSSNFKSSHWSFWKDMFYWKKNTDGTPIWNPYPLDWQQAGVIIGNDGSSYAIAPDTNLIEIIMSEADRLGMSVIVGLGRDNDEYLLRDIYTWQTSEVQANDGNFIRSNDGQAVNSLLINRRIIRAWALESEKALDMLRLYGNHESFVGFYISHEANDLKSALRYFYTADAANIKNLSPSRLVMVAPVGDPFAYGATRAELASLMAASTVDIFAWQDAVGAGINWNHAAQIAQLPALFAKLRDIIDAANADAAATSIKTLWAVTETWEMDGTCQLASTNHYCGAYPATWRRLQQQMSAVAPYVDAITFYEFASTMQSANDPYPLAQNSNAPTGGNTTDYATRAQDLMRCYASAIGVSAFANSSAVCQ